MDRAERKKLIEELLGDLETEKEHQVQHLHNLMRWHYLMQSNNWFPLGHITELHLWSQQALSLLRLKTDELRRMLDELSSVD